jgi:hypothetical protein
VHRRERRCAPGQVRPDHSAAGLRVGEPVPALARLGVLDAPPAGQVVDSRSYPDPSQPDA